MSSSSNPLLVGDLERDVQHAFLDVVQIHHAGQQQRTHFRDGGAHRMTLLAENVPENRRKPVGLEAEPDIAGPFDDKILGLAEFRDAGEVALDVGRKHRNPGPRKSLGHHLQRNGFSGSGGPGDKTVAVCEPERQPGRLFTLSNENFLVAVDRLGIGRRHGIASSRASGVLVNRCRQHTASCKPIETDRRTWRLT